MDPFGLIREYVEFYGGEMTRGAKGMISLHFSREMAGDAMLSRLPSEFHAQGLIRETPCALSHTFLDEVIPGYPLPVSDNITYRTGETQDHIIIDISPLALVSA